MKFFVAALSILMVIAFNFPESSAIFSSNSPANCCFSYVEKQIPIKHVIRHYETPSLCFQPAVVFVTKKKGKICANPKDTWVQKYVNALNLQASGAQNNDS